MPRPPCSRNAVAAAVLAVAAATLVPRAAVAQPKRTGKGGDVGLGASLGDPTGATLKVFLHPRHALESGAGFGPFHRGGGRIHATYLFHSRAWRDDEGFSLHGYVGVGLGVALWYKRYLGPALPSDFKRAALFVRAPVLGLAFHMHEIPLDVYIETAYSPLVTRPATFWNVDFALGARYWF
ncbi:MAG: hypothetical protein IPH07_25520 [Deltaproteobacteria bacterium]|nr:hypothetical protein [Deltaproteobacteria bacterium]MBK8718117.1 hypothetical protein [Deltaproteobacteria bacterium]MBP7288473.1 hypothetical protein [Nannocystaceae bacterium]